MSEGIIQKAFRIAIDRHNALPSSQRGYDIWTSFEVIEIKNEIIAEIKNEYRFGSLNCIVKDVREFLVGEE